MAATAGRGLWRRLAASDWRCGRKSPPAPTLSETIPFRSCASLPETGDPCWPHNLCLRPGGKLDSRQGGKGGCAQTRALAREPGGQCPESDFRGDSVSQPAARGRTYTDRLQKQLIGFPDARPGGGKECRPRVRGFTRGRNNGGPGIGRARWPVGDTAQTEREVFAAGTAELRLLCRRDLLGGLQHRHGGGQHAGVLRFVPRNA